MDEITIRPITADELRAFAAAEGAGFGEFYDEEDLSEWEALVELDRTLAAFEGRRIVATAGADSRTVTLPGLSIVPTAGIVAVAVLPTHRRRGLLRRMMVRQLADIQQRGEVFSILYASESQIYGRFGYGMATQQVSFTLERAHAGFSRPPYAKGTVELIDAAEAVELLPAIYDRARRGQPGAIDRDTAWWQRYFVDSPRHRGDATARFYVMYRAASGEPTGYASYRIKHEWRTRLQQHTLQVTDLFALNAEAQAALWHYVVHVDLVHTIAALNRPIDEPLRYLLADSRRLQATHLSDGLWLRVLDVPAALAARLYAVEDSLVFEVEDTFRPETAGRYRLSGGPDGATCRRTDSEPDLALDIADLGATYLGGTRFGTLARAGRVREITPGALLRADAMFLGDPLPWGTTPF